jgi:hypothetical protein
VELRRDDLVRAAGGADLARVERLATVEREIRQAQAEALGRTGERLQGLLDRLARLDRRLDALLDDVDGRAGSSQVRLETDARNRLRDDALRVRHQLIIQREALGLARQAPVEQCYPVPERRRLSVSPVDGGGEP